MTPANENKPKAPDGQMPDLRQAGRRGVQALLLQALRRRRSAPLAYGPLRHPGRRGRRGDRDEDDRETVKRNFSSNLCRRTAGQAPPG